MYAAPSRMTTTPAPTVQPTYVHPGRTSTAAGVGEFATVVGSGVAVCAWDPVTGVAGVAHFLLPDKGSAPPAPRFGDVGMTQLMDDLARLGAQPTRLRAAVFGGSAPPIAAESGHLGERNVEAAMAFLRARSIPVVQTDVGGAAGRKVVFSPRDGKAQSVRLGATH